MNATQDLRAQVQGRQWYHTLELAPGVLTPGWFDTRALATELPLPASLEGKRCLDVGTFDGFWAFEMERRGAAEVLAVDVLDPLAWDWPHGASPEVIQGLEDRKQGGAGFQIASAALGSKVRYQERSIYELDPDELGRFDFVYVGSLLLHLRDPVRALERVRAVCQGQMLSVDAHDVLMTALFPRRPITTLDGIGRPWWWLPNVAALRRMIEVAGFALAAEPVRLRIPRGAGQRRVPPTLPALRSRVGRRQLLAGWRGDPHVAILARPC
ncbi:MAG TPA: methyltransferase domain-containing protein [Solirubrobacteraceae bacterium]|jgi:tRNA (mo5U34)-methyltransferase|nr:methyltransferase domain-containing protein [Solirubrobacteraceae bacterium]